jgi:hypothetical protein
MRYANIATSTQGKIISQLGIGTVDKVIAHRKDPVNRNLDGFEEPVLHKDGVISYKYKPLGKPYGIVHWSLIPEDHPLYNIAIFSNVLIDANRDLKKTLRPIVDVLMDKYNWNK